MQNIRYMVSKGLINVSFVSAVSEIYSLFFGHRPKRVKRPLVMAQLQEQFWALLCALACLRLRTSTSFAKHRCLLRGAGGSHMLTCAQAVACIPQAVDWMEECQPRWQLFWLHSCFSC